MLILIMPYKDKNEAIKCRSRWNKRNIHIGRKSSWKSMGMKLREGEDWDSIYLFYITCEECENCGIKLTDGLSADGRTLDHNHSTGFIRNVLCRACNIRRG